MDFSWEESKCKRTRLAALLEERFETMDSDITVALPERDEKYAALVEYIRVTDEAENRERLNLYLAGHRDCFAYLNW